MLSALLDAAGAFSAVANSYASLSRRAVLSAHCPCRRLPIHPSLSWDGSPQASTLSEPRGDCSDSSLSDGLP